MRLTNHAEFGTSSSVFTFIARTVPPLAGRRERVDDEVVAVGVLDRLHRRGVGDRVVVDPQGIVGIEVRPACRDHADRAEDGDSREPDDRGAQPARTQT